MEKLIRIVDEEEHKPRVQIYTDGSIREIDSD